ncbi:MAG: polysaccharide pyruvyl transferase family protein [Thermocrispum sp.]
MTGRGPRIGLFGILCSGNLGNDGSLDAVVRHLREHHPDAGLAFFCMGPQEAIARYQAPARHLQWYEAHAGSATGARAAALKVLGKLLDPVRTLAWVRRQDVVIVPGMGVLEATLPLRPWAMPYSLFWLGVAARLTGAKVALVSVGSNVIRKRLTRRLITTAARLAHYRSYRDHPSRDAMRQMGVDVRTDKVYPDLAFALPDPPAAHHDGAVGVGLMAYYGGNDDRADAERLHTAYREAIQSFVRWLVDKGRPVRLFTGDQADQPMVDAILADLRAQRPALEPGMVRVERPATLNELLATMAAVDTVVATRYHNVLCALKLGKPTVSVGYAGKNDVLMASMGLAAYCQQARSVDPERLVEQFTDAEANRNALTAVLAERTVVAQGRLQLQFAELSALLNGRSSR